MSSYVSHLITCRRPRERSHIDPRDDQNPRGLELGESGQHGGVTSSPFQNGVHQMSIPGAVSEMYVILLVVHRGFVTPVVVVCPQGCEQCQPSRCVIDAIPAIRWAIRVEDKSEGHKTVTVHLEERVRDTITTIITNCCCHCYC